MGLGDALGLLARRGRLISALPPGSMLAVMAPPDEVDDLVGGDVSLAAVNAPGLCVLSGPTAAIDEVEGALSARSVAGRRLHTSHAFHSSMMDPILDEFEQVVAGVDLSPPTAPYVATLTGTWADDHVSEPGYWRAQLRSTVRFDEGLRALARDPSPVGSEAVLLEVGPGRTLTTFAGQVARAAGCSWSTLASLPGGDEPSRGPDETLRSLGHLWERGAPVDWQGFHGDERRRRVSLPTYPFERASYWIGTPVRRVDAGPLVPRDVTDWFHVPTWRAVPPADEVVRPLAGAPVLVLDEGAGLGTAMAQRLRSAGARPFLVHRGPGDVAPADHEVTVDPDDPDAFERLAAHVCGTGPRLAGVVDCWGARAPGATDLDTGAYVLFLSVLRLAAALGGRAIVRPLPVLLVARGSDRVLDDDALDPARAFGLGAARVLPQEHPGFRVAHIDVDDDPAVPDQLLAEFLAGAPEPELALRHGDRYQRDYDRTPLPVTAPADGLPPDPVVMITGGLGHMGLTLAEAVFAAMGARVVLVGRSALPDADQWADASERSDGDERERAVLRRLAAMRAERDDVMVVAADLTSARQVVDAVDAAHARFGRIDVVVHGAANVSPAAFGAIADTGPSVVAAQLSPKIVGLHHLVDAMAGREPARWVLHSSISSALGGLGLAAYAGANAVLDATAARGGAGWLSIGWDAWDNAAEAQSAAVQDVIQPAEGQDAFLRMLGAPPGPRVIAAVGDFGQRVETWVRHAQPTTRGGTRHPRPNLSTSFAEAATETERALVEIWGSQLGLERVGVHDRFFDLGGDSLLAVQLASEIRDRFQIEMPVLEIFKAPIITELAALIDQAEASGGFVESPSPAGAVAAPAPVESALGEDGPGGAAKASYRAFYDDVSRRLEATGMSEASFFLNYGYISLGRGDEAVRTVPDGTFNPNSVRLAYELIGPAELAGQRVLDVGCGRGGTVALLAEQFDAVATGVDLSPEAVAFCRRAHRHPSASFEVGDAESLPFEPDSFDVVTNLESSHTYPDLRAFLAEVRRVLRAGGSFLHTDLLAGQRWIEVEALLAALGLTVVTNREITANVLASCDEVAQARTGAFGARDAAIDNFLAVPGSPVYEQMASGSWEYRIVRSERR
jgi:SAM-dependent methyltransferase/NAD(P)-dependent dehydrogenase (short-subunit alcohol dehydrogenase family)/acyl carrier protein